jgi:hypothetical protein
MAKDSIQDLLDDLDQRLGRLTRTVGQVRQAIEQEDMGLASDMLGARAADVPGVQFAYVALRGAVDNQSR